MTIQVHRHRRAVDLPKRQRTLRATVEWSVGLLDDGERSLLETMAVFTGGWTIDAAAQLAGLGEDRALELLEALARHSLIQLDSTAPAPAVRCLRPSVRSWPSGWRPGPMPQGIERRARRVLPGPGRAG